MDRMHALLIGIDCYMANVVPVGLTFGHLNGCVRDINLVEAYLNSLAKKPDRLLKLTASGPGLEPSETDKAGWPTYQNVVNAFKDLTEQATEGDLIYIHYSGHGVRTTTAYADIKGAGQLDEGLVPMDYGQPNGNYVRDIQLAYLIQEMLKKKLRVTIVFDSCHSGGATRGVSSATPRGVAGTDTVVRPLDNLVATPEQLKAFWTTLMQGGARAATSVGGWLVEPKGYTLLAACRANELAYEDFFDPTSGIKNGALTYWLLDSLRTLGTGVTYKRLEDRILAKIRGWKDDQTPQLQGEGDLIVFGEERVQSHFAIPVLKYDQTKQLVTLNAGEVHGLAVGSQLAIYPSADSDFTAKEQRLAVVEVTELKGESDSLAKVVEAVNVEQIEAGNQAVLLGTPNLRLQRTVSIASQDLPGRQAIETALEIDGAGFIRLATAGEKIDFQVATNEARDVYQLWDSSGNNLPILPPIQINAQDAAVHIVRRLVHLTKYRNVQALDNPDSSIANKLRLELIGAGIDENGRGLVVEPDRAMTLRIYNDLPPNLLNAQDKTRIVNVTVLDLQSDWAIGQLFPAEAGASELVQPEKYIDLQVQMTLPEGSSECTDILKVFATQQTTNFQWLALPALDETAQPKASTRGASTDPLDQLLEAVSEDQLSAETITRAAKLIAPTKQSKPWTVAQLEVHVKKV